MFAGLGGEREKVTHVAGFEGKRERERADGKNGACRGRTERGDIGGLVRFAVCDRESERARVVNSVCCNCQFSGNL